MGYEPEFFVDALGFFGVHKLAKASGVFRIRAFVQWTDVVIDLMALV